MSTKLVIGERPAGKPNIAEVVSGKDAQETNRNAIRVGGKMIDEKGATKVTVHDVAPKKGK